MIKISRKNENKKRKRERKLTIGKGFSNVKNVSKLLFRGMLIETYIQVWLFLW